MNEFDKHELLMDQEAADTNQWIAYFDTVEKLMGHDLDGDQEENGYSIDWTYNFYKEGLTPIEAAAEFVALKKIAVQTTLAKKLHAYAEVHYNDGFDTFVECGMEYCMEFVDGLTTWDDVLEMAKRIMSVVADRRADGASYLEGEF